MQTSATIGYGSISPAGLAANIVVAVEAFVGLLGFAMITGLLFARFSRPTAKILFSKNSIISPYQAISAFEFRIANARSNQLIEVEVQVIFSRLESLNGERIRKYHKLNLERSKVPFFPLSWTIVHPIDNDSPLLNQKQDELINSSAEFLILITAFDETFSQTVHTRTSYKADEIVFDARFANIFELHKINSPISIDISQLDEIEKIPSHD